ncbi:Protein archease [Geodia barretti]|uniref:Protein archease n=1 Tax=Geodia barretti TaxID=519541 RepID=A0AA35X338_GEOBA|nr:Protein archease [Geodia barretti]
MASGYTEPPCDPPEVSRAFQQAEMNKDPTRKYEYLDHPADIQIHAWGDSIEEAFEQAAVGMFGYMTELSTVEETGTETIEAEGHDLESLLFKFLDEFLFLFSAEPFFTPKRVKITDFNKETFVIKAEGYGETFDLNKHPQGTEVKAITYSNMQIHHNQDGHEIYVIVDI